MRSSSICLLGYVGWVAGLTYNVPSSRPSNSSGAISSTPIGISFEFFAFPAYMNDVDSTSPCLENFKDLTGTWPPIRIGGTTQDRATYDSSLTTEVDYTVSDPADAPSSLRFGPSFMTLAGTYGGAVTVGLNRRLNDISNTEQAAAAARSNMNNLYAIELGNEPNFFTSSDPIAGGSSWTASRDYSSEVSWQTSVGQYLGTSNIFQAGVFFGTSFNIAGLAATESSTALGYVKTFASHFYPQSASTADLATLMSHTNIKSTVSSFSGEVSAAKSKGKIHVFGETNSATQGGGGISPTFGAGLWILDYVMQALLLGTQNLFFHHGTVGNCQYCWWGRYDMGAPYYGAYFATMALANVAYIAPLDAQTTSYAAYALYSSSGAPVKVLLYNSDYYTSGTRSSQSVTLTGLSSSSVTAKRLTAAAATSRQDQGYNPTVGGQTFANGTCVLQGTAQTESASVNSGSATFTVGASEALLVYL